MKPLLLAFVTLLLAAPAAAVPTQDQSTASGESPPLAGRRDLARTIEAEIVALNPATREVSLKGPSGRYVTLWLNKTLYPFEQLAMGDRVAAEYISSLEGTVREPTAEELANPWLVTSETVTDETSQQLGVGLMRRIRAVCTIVALAPTEGYAMVRDSRGYLHTINDIETEKFATLTAGDTVVFQFVEAVAVSFDVLDS